MELEELNKVFLKTNELINEFNSISEAARALKTTVTSIQNCLKGRSKTSNGYKWRYK